MALWGAIKAHDSFISRVTGAAPSWGGLLVFGGGEIMPWHTGKPAADDFLSVSVQHIRENFAELEPLQPHVAELVDLTALQPHVAALLDSRIVEMGSNSNGEYVRWENGLQVCFTSLSTSASQDTLWTLPAAFIDSEWVFVGSVGELFAAGARVITFEGRTTNSVTLRIFSASGNRVAGTAFIIAIGRWK